MIQHYLSLMGFKESLINVIRNISNASGSVKASVCVGTLAYIFHFTGIISDRWLQGGTSSNNHQGLWNFCQDSNGYECCSTITDHVNEIGSSRPEYIVATIVFIIFGILAATVALIASCKELASEISSTPKCGFFTVFFILAAFFLLIAVSVYGGQYQYYDLTKDNNLHVSFGLTVVAMFLYIIAAVFITCC